jgi:predicted secreted hydrolase
VPSRKARTPLNVFALFCLSVLGVALVHSKAIADPTTATSQKVDIRAVDKTAAGYLMATVPRQWSFPSDHGRHDGFKTEWWYFTGNVADNVGRKFGYQLTFFRVSISPIAIAHDSPVSPGDFYFAHLAVSDLDGGQSHEGDFHFKDRMDHEAAGVAASSTDTLDVSLRDWSAKLQSAHALPGGPGNDLISLEATDSGFGIHLACSGDASPVLQGPGGINKKGRERIQASYYYSMPRLPTSGTIVVGGQTFHVTGQSWMDHEFSSNAIGANQVGWDWVGVRLDDGRSLMVYRLRNKAGDSDFLSGTVIDASGNAKYLTDQQITFTGRSPWKSESGGSYPQVWSLNVAGLPPLLIHSRMPGQELRTAATTRIDYFEGSCDVTTPDHDPVGEGYLEMTGYAKPIDPF